MCWERAESSGFYFFADDRIHARIRSIWLGAKLRNSASKTMFCTTRMWVSAMQMPMKRLWWKLQRGAVKHGAPRVPCSVLPLAPHLFLVFRLLIADQVSPYRFVIYISFSGGNWTCLSSYFPLLVWPKFPRATISALTLCRLLPHFLLFDFLLRYSQFLPFLHPFCSFSSDLVIPSIPPRNVSPISPLGSLFFPLFLIRWMQGDCRSRDAHHCYLYKGFITEGGRYFGIAVLKRRNFAISERSKI